MGNAAVRRCGEADADAPMCGAAEQSLRCAATGGPRSVHSSKGAYVTKVVGRRNASTVSKYIAFAEIPDEIVVGRFRTVLGDVAEAPRHAPLHVEPREFGDDPRDLRLQGMVSYCRPTTSRQMPAVHSATSASL